MHLDLVLDVVFTVHDEEVIALVDKLLVEWIINRAAIYPIFDEKHGQILYTKTSQ